MNLSTSFITTTCPDVAEMAKSDKESIFDFIIWLSNVLRLLGMKIKKNYIFIELLVDNLSFKSWYFHFAPLSYNNFIVKW